MDKEYTDLSSITQCIKMHEMDFKNIISRRLGIVIHHHQSNELVKTILNACQTFHCNTTDYLNRLRDAPDDSPLLEHLIAGITVNETYFFRDKQQMQLLQKTLLPQLIQSKRAAGDLSLRIWSAGCATGEEIYTLGMMLLELIPDFAAWRLQLLGTDLNARSLQKAIVGHYTEWSMRSISNYFKQHYFSFKNNRYIICAQIRNLVNFSYLNLHDHTYPSLFNRTNAQDLILCRNVLIYFDHEHIGQLMKKLNDSLIPGGYLLLGASDPIVTEYTPLIFHHQLGTLFSRPIMETITTPSLQTVEKTKRFTMPQPVTKKIVTPMKSSLPSSIHLNQDPPSIAKLLSESRWQEAITAIHRCETAGKKDSSLLNSKAMAYANLGQLEQSLQSCLESLKLEATNKYTYFTYALTLNELNRLDEAEDAFRKTLFLDRHFVVGHFQLGLLLFRKKQYKMGMKSLTNALTIAEAEEPSEMVPGSQGLNYGQLSEIFKHEIEMYAATGNISHVTQNLQK